MLILKKVSYKAMKILGIVKIIFISSEFKMCSFLKALYCAYIKYIPIKNMM